MSDHRRLPTVLIHDMKSVEEGSGMSTVTCCVTQVTNETTSETTEKRKLLADAVSHCTPLVFEPRSHLISRPLRLLTALAA